MDAGRDCRLAEENELLRKEVQRLRQECKMLQKTTREHETSISILTMTCEQLVDELESLGEREPLNDSQTDESQANSTLAPLPSPPPPSSSGQTYLSCLPGSPGNNQHYCPPSISQQTSSCHRCQLLTEELSTTRQELKLVDKQLKCAAKQKYHLQEKLCQYEEDIGVLVQRQLLHKLE